MGHPGPPAEQPAVAGAGALGVDAERLPAPSTSRAMSSEAIAALVSSRSTGTMPMPSNQARTQRALEAGAGEVVRLREEDHLPRHHERDHDAVGEARGGCWPRSPGRWPARCPGRSPAGARPPWRQAAARRARPRTTWDHRLPSAKPARCADVLPRRPLGGRRRGHSSKGSLGCGGPSVGSTPSNRLLTDSPACTREMASANSSATDRIFSSGQSRRRRDGVGGDHLGDHRVVAQPLDGLADEQPVRAGHRAPVQPSSASRSSSSTIEPPVAISSSRTIARLPSTSPTIASMTTRSSASRCLLPAATGRPSSRENWVAVLALPKSGRDHDGVGEVLAAEVVGEHAEGGQVVDRHREEAVHLRRVQRHRQHPARRRR